MMQLNLTSQQTRDIVDAFIKSATEVEMKRLLQLFISNNFHTVDHTEMVKFHMKTVIRECALPKDYFRHT